MTAFTNGRCAATIAALGMLGCVASCLDASPVDYTAAADAGSRDGAGEASKAESCRACMLAPEQPGPGCAAAIAPCVDDEKCWAIVECTLTTGCLEYGSLNPRVECGIPCVEQVGITSFNDPSVLRSIAIQECTLAACRSACVVE
ncbi:MAG TPA: hypothetical protein VK524_06250 [Polyangiaceae bacterium]|nr:hypothetical protein [Polyangiaceae bacterium]